MKSKMPIVQVLAELRAMRVPELIVRYEELHGRPPRTKNKSWLWKRCAWRVQEQRFGGLSEVARRRIDELIQTLDLPFAPNASVASDPVHRSDDGPPVGTSLVREWRGREVLATRTEEGWECDGVVHRSLTAAARAVTGARWSGPLFWGTKKRGERRA